MSRYLLAARKFHQQAIAEFSSAIELEDRDPRVRTAAVADRYRVFLHTLHSECFYDGAYSVNFVQRELRRVGEFIRQVERL